MSEIATIAMSNVDKKTNEGETPVKLCNFVDVYRNWAITKDLIPTLMSATAKPQEIEKFTLSKGQVALTKDSETRDDIGIATYIADNMDNVLLGYHCAVLTPNSALVDSKYLNAYMHSNIVHKYFENNASGSGQRYTLSYDALLNIPVLLPDLELQKGIGQIFSNIDRKIALNRQINDNLEAMARQLYDYWFVQFDFPDENGKPYKSSGRKMVWNKEIKRAIPFGWKISPLSELLEVNDARRIPLSNKQRAERQGFYPYYGATGIMDYVDNFLFDEDLLLLAEDGSTSDGNGHPIVQYIWGKNWVNNHAHILKPKSVGQLYYYYFVLKQIPVALIETGSIQRKISQQNLLSYKVAVPSENLIQAYSNVANVLQEQRKKNSDEIVSLTKQRDELLPLLMNGQVTVNYHLSLAHITPTTLAPLCTP